MKKRITFPEGKDVIGFLVKEPDGTIITCCPDGSPVTEDNRPLCCSPEDVADLVSYLKPKKKEHFVTLLLDTRRRLLKVETTSIGTLTSSLVHPREVFQPAVTASAAAIIVVHNHPSGDPEPSAEDIALTRRLRQGGELLGIELLDHIIIGSKGWVSLKARGQL
jgi:DNA repair protein RadC